MLWLSSRNWVDQAHEATSGLSVVFSGEKAAQVSALMCVSAKSLAVLAFCQSGAMSSPHRGLTLWHGWIEGQMYHHRC